MCVIDRLVDRYQGDGALGHGSVPSIPPPGPVVPRAPPTGAKVCIEVKPLATRSKAIGRKEGWEHANKDENSAFTWEGFRRTPLDRQKTFARNLSRNYDRLPLSNSIRRPHSELNSSTGVLPRSINGRSPTRQLPQRPDSAPCGPTGGGTFLTQSS